ncbi:MAG: MOSC domain-containing protein [Aggregatilineales bacterium]
MSDITLVSIQVGGIKTHTLDNGEAWTTAYEKTPVTGAVNVHTLHLEGDDQKHKKVHGGVHRAVLAYSVSHYTYWEELLKRELPYGVMGENLTIQGLSEDTVAIGDIYALGDVRLQVSQPRQPCNQISQFLKSPDLHKRVKSTGYTGWYLRVLQEGTIEAGIPVIKLESHHPEWTISRIQRVYGSRRKYAEESAQLAKIEALNPEWREKFAASST